MKCLGCYKENVEGYCNACRRKLFDGKKISHVLNFPSPKAETFLIYKETPKSFSISGVQLKYSLKIENKQLVLTEAGGQYILKPIPPAAFIAKPDQTPENEHLTMQIANQIFKIPVAENALIYFNDGTPSYLTRRFDVKADGTKYLQEDFAQISGKAPKSHGEHFKYSGTYEDIGKLIKQFVVASSAHLEAFFKVVVFNYIFSNGDAHLKNFSLYKTPYGDYGLTRAYDLMCTVLHTPLESNTALDLYEGDIESRFYQKFGCYGRENFEMLAEKIGLLPLRTKNIIDSLLTNQKEVLEMIDKSFLSKEAKEKYVHYYNDKIARFNKLR
jgi:serine/threonine-protein kinase HipA